MTVLSSAALHIQTVSYKDFYGTMSLRSETQSCVRTLGVDCGFLLKSQPENSTAVL